ncbi:MAG: PQQ-binding-like beta-propeller repeat protein [Fuerstiella sp.]
MNTPDLSRRKMLVSCSAATLGSMIPSFTKAAGQNGDSAVSGPTKTSWASFRQDPAQRGIAGCKFSKSPKLKWEFKSKDGWVATSAVVGQHVYAPALSGDLHCLDLQTGKEIWKYRSIESKDPKDFAPGFKAAPLVTTDRIYVGDEDGILHAIDRASGKLLWKYETSAEIAGGVALYQDRVLLASHDASLYCLKTTGKEQWQFETNDRINCSPGLAGDFTFVSGCDAELRVIDLKSGKEARNVPMESYLIASPAIVDEMLYVGSHGGAVSAVNWKSGQIQWNYRGKRAMPFHASAAVTDNLVLVGSHDKNLHAIDRFTGEGRWLFPTKARIDCSAAVVDQRVFFGSADGNIYGLSVTDGKQVWKHNAGKAVNAGIAIGEECLIAGEDDVNGRLLCFG